MKNCLILLFFLLYINYCDAQFAILDKISGLQVESDSFYAKGLFPSQITWKNGRRSIEDNNLFFNALTVYTLQSIKKDLSTEQQELVDQITFQTEKAFVRYKNRNGDITYNFYETEPENPFPGFTYFNNYEFAKLPDDLDDTAIIYLVKSSGDSLNRQLKNKMTEQSLGKGKLYSTFKEYRWSLAYRTWFADKMKQDLDVVVNCNVLSFVFQNGLPLDTVDYEAIEFIKDVVLTNKHMEYPHLVSSYYQNSSIILYHLARLIAIANHAEISQLRKKIISDLQLKLESTDNLIERVILLSSLYRLGKEVGFQLDYLDFQSDMKEFHWFKTNFICGKRFWIKRLFGKKHFLNYHHKSEAYYWSLVLELKTISNARIGENGNYNTMMYRDKKVR